MKNFSEWYSLKEDTSDSQVEIAFSDAENKVKEIFSYLSKFMTNTWGKKSPSWDSQIREKVITDLQNVISKLKGNTEKNEAVDYAKSSIRDSILICEGKELPGWIQTILGNNRTITVDRMLSSMQNEIIKILHSLRDEILVKKVNSITGEVGKVGNKVSRTLGKNIRKIGKDIQTQVAGGVKVHQDISGSDRSAAKYNLVRLFNATKFRPETRLYSGISSTRALRYSPNNEMEVASILDKLNKGKNFRIRIAGKDHFFDITNDGDTSRILELIAEQ